MASRLLSAYHNSTTGTYLTPTRLLRIAIALLAIAIYMPSLSGMAIWDDHALLSGQAIGGGKSLIDCFTHPFLGNYYRPLTSASFYVDRHLWGAGPFFYHQTNILIHMLTTLAVMRLLETAFRKRRIGFLGGFLFAIQPVQVSTVA